jgi:hypothetical protein
MGQGRDFRITACPAAHSKTHRTATKISHNKEIFLMTFTPGGPGRIRYIIVCIRTNPKQGPTINDYLKAQDVMENGLKITIHWPTCGLCPHGFGGYFG